MDDKLTIEEVKILLSEYRSKGKISKASLASTLLWYMQRCEVLEAQILAGHDYPRYKESDNG